MGNYHVVVLRGERDSNVPYLPDTENAAIFDIMR
jgi:hypothetical protein